ncbi:MAG: peptidylprolyl isomerase [Streptococcaceae bacterium]|jgi:foldase protein PrsA|nr:peptidylprolyl isomerase [Streptococcaceae bacterium]
MKKSKKIMVGIVSLAAVVTLGACSSSKDIVSMKGSTITVNDFYQKAKTQSASQQVVRDMIIYKVFSSKYAKDVTDKEVTAKYDEQKKGLGDSFSTALSSAGYTETTFKEYLKNNLALEAGLKAHIKIKDADLKTAWKTFHPEVTASIIKAASEDDANAILKDVQAEGSDFAKIAKEKSTDTATKDKGGKITFDSTSTEVPDEVKTAAWKLKNDEVSAVISSTDTSTYQTVYYIVKMDKTSKKGSDLKKYKKQLTDIAEQTKLSDQTFVKDVISSELKKANVKIKDDAFSSVLSDFISTEASTSTSSTKKASTSKSSTKSSTKKSSSEEKSSKSK